MKLGTVKYQTAWQLQKKLVEQDQRRKLYFREINRYGWSRVGKYHQREGGGAAIKIF